jgi:hypothetical protein
MIVKIYTARSNSFECENEKCQNLSEYISLYHSEYRIKKGTRYVKFGNFTYYCGGCIDEIYNEVKLKLNRKLWAFQ